MGQYRFKEVHRGTQARHVYCLKMMLFTDTHTFSNVLKLPHHFSRKITNYNTKMSKSIIWRELAMRIICSQTSFACNLLELLLCAHASAHQNQSQLRKYLEF